MKLIYCLYILWFVSSLSIAQEAESLGIIKLDNTTFDKIIPKFKAVLVKFDKAFVVDEKQNHFRKIGEMAIPQPELIVVEVDIKEQGKQENVDLKERFNLTTSELPDYWLFLNGGKETKIYRGPEDDTLKVAKFVIENTGFWIGLPGSLEEFDNIVKLYFSSPKEKHEDIIRQAESALSKIDNKKEMEKAEVYIKILRKVYEIGPEFVAKDLARIKKLVRGNKVGTKKRLELNLKNNVLTVFQSIIKAQKVTDAREKEL